MDPKTEVYVPLDLQTKPSGVDPMVNHALYNSKLRALAENPLTRHVDGPWDAVHRAKNRCGDTVDLFHKEGEGVAAEVGGCSVCRAATVLMLLSTVKGGIQETVSHLGPLADWFTGNGPCPETLGELEVALGGVHLYPDRIPCALLPWKALLKLKEKLDAKV